MVSSQDPSPLKWSKHSLKWRSHGPVLGNAHSFVSRVGRQSVTPATALHIASTQRGNPPLCQLLWWSLSPSLSPLPLQLLSPSPSPLQLPLSLAIAVVIVVGHCRCHWRWPLSLPLQLAIAVTVSVAIAVAIAIAVSHCCRRCRQPSSSPLPTLSPLPLPFEQSKQIMLTLF